MKTLLTILILFAFSLAYAEAGKELTLDEFNKQINKANSEELYRSTIIRQDGLHTLLIVPDAAEGEGESVGTIDTTKPPTPPADPDNTGSSAAHNAGQGDNTDAAAEQLPVAAEPVMQTGVDTKIGSQTGSEQGQSVPKSNKSAGAVKKPAVQPVANKDFYFPSSMSKTNNARIDSVSVTFSDTKVKFGISIGSAIPIRLRRTSTNVQPGYIELVTLADIAGRKKILPAGSIIFSRPNVVKGSSRLYLNTVRGVTPEGDEFLIRGHISDSFNTAGLTGIIKSDGRALERSAAAGAIALGGSLVSELSDGSIGSAAGSAANQMISEGSAQSKANLDKAAFIVSSSPQDGTLTVEETF